MKNKKAVIVHNIGKNPIEQLSLLNPRVLFVLTNAIISIDLG
ncbi:DUF4408 domain-containing protein [Rossellomorea aquimaris]|nr:DUF4408 domain-containing protein [Rossellomorea aquimaris]